MITGRESCSCASTVGKRFSAAKLGKAKARAVASCELGSASIVVIGSGQPAGFDEACIEGEESAKRILQAPRGVRRQRALKQPSGTWETLPESQTARLGKRTTGSHNRRGLGDRESDGLIVAMKSRSSRD